MVGGLVMSSRDQAKKAFFLLTMLKLGQSHLPQLHLSISQRRKRNMRKKMKMLKPMR